MNKLQQQASQNEVQLSKIAGDIEEEKKIAELLEIQTENSNARNQMLGRGEAEKVRSFLEGLKEVVPDFKKRNEIWNILRKSDMLDGLNAKGVKMYLTPKECNLSIENHEHENVSTPDSGSDRMGWKTVEE